MLLLVQLHQVQAGEDEKIDEEAYEGQVDKPENYELRQLEGSLLEEVRSSLPNDGVPGPAGTVPGPGLDGYRPLDLPSHTHYANSIKNTIESDANWLATDGYVLRKLPPLSSYYR